MGANQESIKCSAVIGKSDSGRPTDFRLLNKVVQGGKLAILRVLVAVALSVTPDAVPHGVQLCNVHFTTCKILVVVVIL